MTKLKIIECPDPFLEKPSIQVEEITEEIKTLAKDMAETMKEAVGVGLAAPQVGYHLRMVAISPTKRKRTEPPRDDELDAPALILINPKVTWASEKTAPYEEGCLSVPGIYAKVDRPTEVKVKYMTLSGEEKEEHFKDMMAVIVQHEMDHLDGILFIRHLSKLKQKMIQKRMQRIKNAAL